jgi:hypothetical protein
MEYTCPLCDQPVSKSVFDKITGIWKARQKALDDIKKQRVQLNQKFKLEKKKLTKKLAEERKKFAQQRAAAIEKAVNAKTRQFERQIVTLRRKEAKVERLASLKIKQATQRAHADALKLAKCQIDKFKKNLRASVKEQLEV